MNSGGFAGITDGLSARPNDSLTLERLREQGERLLEEISFEQYLAHSGRKVSANLSPIYERHHAVLSTESLSLVREMFESARADAPELRSVRALLEWQLEALAARELAGLDEEIMTREGSSAARLSDGREIGYQRLLVELTVTGDRDARAELEKARARLATAELAPIRRERVARERDLMLRQRIAPGFMASWSLTSGIDLQALLEGCRAFLSATADMWNELLTHFLRSNLRLRPGEATRADALYLFRATEWDGAFPGNRLMNVVRDQLHEMGVDLSEGDRIVLDLENRDRKRARAFCAPVRIPDEVYLVLLPQGGRSDYRMLLHELGHALHFARADAALPFEFRWLGDNSVTEGYAMLFDHLLHDDGWLLRYTDLPRGMARDHRRRCAFEELHYVRRYCAKLLFEAEAYEGLVESEDAGRRYVEFMTESTGFRYAECDAFVDFDPRFYSARYLRAWQLQALLGAALRERFNEDWFRNPRAGPWLVSELLEHGQRELADELAVRAAGRSLSFDALQARVEELAS